MFPHTVTLYNKHTEAGIEKWQRTVLPGVFWSSSKGAVLRKMGVVTPDGLQATTQIIIPMSVNVFRKYLKPEVWKAKTDKTDSWTLQAGDTMVLGEITQEVVATSKELRQLDDVILITAVDTKNFGAGMSNWEVTGK